MHGQAEQTDWARILIPCAPDFSEEPSRALDDEIDSQLAAADGADGRSIGISRAAAFSKVVRRGPTAAVRALLATAAARRTTSR